MQLQVELLANSLSAFCAGSCQAQCCKRGRIVLPALEGQYFSCKVIRPDGLQQVDLSKGCEHLTDQQCAIYDRRPVVCREYPLFLRYRTLIVASCCAAVKAGVLDEGLQRLQVEFPELRVIRQ